MPSYVVIVLSEFGSYILIPAPPIKYIPSLDLEIAVVPYSPVKPSDFSSKVVIILKPPLLKFASPPLVQIHTPLLSTRISLILFEGSPSDCL